MGLFSQSVLLVLSLGLVLGVPSDPQRIAGGSLIAISNRPYVAALLYSSNLQTFRQECVGTIISNTAILTAAHCVFGDLVSRWRVRVGSSYANSGGVVHNVRLFQVQPYFNYMTRDSDVAVLRTATTIVYTVNVQRGSIAGVNYVIGDNQLVYGVGWGIISNGGPYSEQLRQVQIWSVNQAVCRQRHAERGLYVTDNMLCAGWLDVGGRDLCQGDNGGPLLHNNVVVGVYSWGQECGSARYPAVTTRVSRYSTWIQQVSV